MTETHPASGEPAYAWLVDYDHLDHKPVRVLGPRDITDGQEQALARGEGVRFRLLDGDGIVYYTGRFLGDAESEDGFGPLEDYGTPDSGCTGIQYRNPATGQWEAL
jgi:hypothetical protein